MQAPQQIVPHQPHEVGDIVGFLHGSATQGTNCLDRNYKSINSLMLFSRYFGNRLGLAWLGVFDVRFVLVLSGLQLSKDDGSQPPEGESDEDVAGSMPCIDQGKASRGHTRCVKCGHSKNPSAKLQCVHCGAYLRDQTKARVAQRWAMLKDKAKREGRLGDKVREFHYPFFSPISHHR